MTPVRNVTQFTAGPYRVPHQHVTTYATVTNKTPSGTHRGQGGYEGSFFMERLIDMAAKDLGLYRLDIRSRNLIALAEMPYAMALVRPHDGFNDTSCDSGDEPALDRHQPRLGRDEDAEGDLDRRRAPMVFLVDRIDE